MNIGIKIFLGIMILLGILGGVFLLVAKKKPAASTTRETEVVQTSQTAQTKAPEVQTPKIPPTKIPDAAKKAKPAISDEVIQTRKSLIRSQWAECKSKTILAGTNLTWNVKITEGIPAGGTYAKGNLDNDLALPVHVIIKSDSKNLEKIKAMLVVGKTAFLRGTCTDVATDGSVVLQAF